LDGIVSREACHAHRLENLKAAAGRETLDDNNRSYLCASIASAELSFVAIEGRRRMKHRPEEIDFAERLKKGKISLAFPINSSENEL